VEKVVGLFFEKGTVCGLILDSSNGKAVSKFNLVLLELWLWPGLGLEPKLSCEPDSEL